jgi:inosose dehydratase
MSRFHVRIANAPCSWGVIENTAGERSGYRRVIEEMHETGYAGTELGDWGFMPTDPARLRAELNTLSLSLLGSWVSVRLYDAAYHARGVEQAVMTAKLLAAVGGPGAFVIVGDDHSTVPSRTRNAGRIRPQDALDERGWSVYTAGIERVARAVREQTGLRTLIHHHGATYVETPDEIAVFLDRTDPDLVGLCFDTGHYALGGGDPVDGLRRHFDRVGHVHFKDFDPDVVSAAAVKGWDYQQMIGQGVFPELGQGSVDFPAVLREMNELGYNGWIVVEQDVLPGMGTPKESAARNREFLRQLGV